MGTCHLSFPGIFGSVSILRAHSSRFGSNMRHDVNLLMHENYKASKIGQEKTTKNASSSIYIGIFHRSLPESELADAPKKSAA
ncbi:hypothetical protein QQ045_019877 [Rhodiola kirilowii]